MNLLFSKLNSVINPQRETSWIFSIQFGWRINCEVASKRKTCDESERNHWTNKTTMEENTLMHIRLQTQLNALNSVQRDLRVRIGIKFTVLSSWIIAAVICLNRFVKFYSCSWLWFKRSRGYNFYICILLCKESYPNICLFFAWSFSGFELAVARTASKESHRVTITEKRFFGCSFISGVWNCRILSKLLLTINNEYYWEL